MKLVTRIAALDRLDRLGPNHCGFTELRSAAPLQGGVLRGELMLKSGAGVEPGVPQLWALRVDHIARHGPHPQAMIVGPQGEVP